VEYRVGQTEACQETSLAPSPQPDWEQGGTKDTLKNLQIFCETSSALHKNARAVWDEQWMRSYFAPAIAMVMIMAAILSARPDDIPTLDVNPVCRGIASQSELEAGLQRTNFEQCIQSEQAVREQVKKEWSTFSTADKTHCVALAKTGGESSYTELLTCMEMARDVRKLHSEADNSSTPVPEGLPAPVGHRQPTAQ
jgi:hypothetical protein